MGESNFYSWEFSKKKFLETKCNTASKLLCFALFCFAVVLLANTESDGNTIATSYSTPYAVLFLLSFFWEAPAISLDEDLR